MSKIGANGKHGNECYLTPAFINNIKEQHPETELNIFQCG